ncbi:MAG TPA: hypothetical protein VIO64_20390 [Pseudobacteroides sp.]|uniref:hypothetical protein n=1 Tax=Pseudobacteroides sp. TaxID=1968840 RepID=UPI002F94A77E
MGYNNIGKSGIRRLNKGTIYDDKIATGKATLKSTLYLTMYGVIRCHNMNDSIKTFNK